MPAGIAVGTLAIGRAGATNAAILAAQILSLTFQILLKMWLISAQLKRKKYRTIFWSKHNGPIMRIKPWYFGGGQRAHMMAQNSFTTQYSM